MTHKTKHTPGPWIVRNMSDAMAEKFTVERLSNNGLRSVICRINDMEVCPEHGGTGSEANAALIAAAPAMYAALQNLLEFIKGNRGAREGNPYCKAEVRQALKVLASIQGKKDYLDADTLPQAEGKHD